MTDDHQAGVAVFQREAQYGSDTDLKKFASMMIPIV
jgi:hypothetical protein